MQQSTTKWVAGQGEAFPEQDLTHQEGIAALGLPRLEEGAWEQIVAEWPVAIEASARQWKALQRRRQVRSGAALLRLVFAYALCDWPLRLVGAWARVIGLGHLSDVAVLKRLRPCQAWLGYLVGQGGLGQRAQPERRGLRVRLVDATVVSRPGSRGTDWRVHVSWALGDGVLEGLEITDATGGETLVRHPARPGDILVADRGYAHPKGIGSVLAAGGDLVVRINWQNLPLETEEGQVWDLFAWLASIPETGVAEHRVWVQTPQGRFPMRLIAGRLTPEGAEAARRRARQAARKKGHTPDQRTLTAAGFVLVVTTLPAEGWSGEEVMRLYRLRWQVELVFKRLKGLWQIDALRAKEARLSQVYLLGKVLGALLADGWTAQVATWQPQWWLAVARPVSLGRLSHLWVACLRHAVQGPLGSAQVWAVLPALGRYLRDAPRDRPQQAATARAWLHQRRQALWEPLCQENTHGLPLSA